MIDFEENTPNTITIEDVYSLFLTGQYTLDDLVEKCRGKFSRTKITTHISNQLQPNKK